MNDKLVLGTAQVGFSYGIANKRGKPSKLEAYKIMQTAVEYNIDCFDTAYSYGTSEEIIGDFLQRYKFDHVKIITKLPALTGDYSKEKIYDLFFTSLHRLKQKSIFCYMVHSVADILNDSSCFITRAFRKLKRDGLIRKIGVSVYEKEEIKSILDNFDFDVIQLPFSIFDQRLLKDSILEKLKKKGKEIYARSVFLQGLLFLDKDNLSGKLKKFLVYRNKFERLAERIGLSKEEMALLFVYSKDDIDKIIVGVDNVVQLKRNINILNKLEYFKIISSAINFEEFSISDSFFIDPRKWNLQ